MKCLKCIFIILILVSCQEKPQIKYSGFDDLVVGSNTVNLYENGEFNIEIGLEYNSGTYEIRNDTAFLAFYNPNFEPIKIILNNNVLAVEHNSKTTRVRRTDNLNKEESSTISKEGISQPGLLRLSSKLKVIDGSTDNNLNYCEGEIKKYAQMGKYDCSFIIDSIEYNLRSKYVYDSLNKVQSYWSYKAEGPLIYSSEDLMNDQKFVISIGADKIPMKYESLIIDGDDTMKIESINEELNLIFMEKNRNEKFRVIYEFK